MNCRICRTPLKPTQGVYCSRACSNRGLKRIQPRSCPVCDRSLTYAQLRNQNRYCSSACANGSRRIHPDRDCAACGRPLRREQLRNRAACSVACARSRVVMPASMLDAVLAILRANTDWYMTCSDLSIWLFGYDDESEIHCVRNHVYRLRRLGYRLETRQATWEPIAPGVNLAYRLVSEPASATGRAA